MAYRWEVDLYKPLKRYLGNRSFRIIEEEVDFFERRIDLFCFSRKLDKSIAVEAKLKDWKKALRQALLYQLCSDFVYVAMPADVFKVINKDTFFNHGVGFLALYESGACRELIPARPSSVLTEVYRTELINFL
ncbi:hypothetical protein M902_0728 [Bacteriovorax sp. BAL6_X]|uniref:hypothetical protein n=1 Tax=Bacteriovorax sp. BAL6_X TaxID=1201290 RepID=UPI000385BA55|nr:hypothetical protein [Bacteriovorax sp. BAL6_X]EPZ49728.1 hypothetical protein M902_0728 [Bacteriovorax sp. BAL6_X]